MTPSHPAVPTQAEALAEMPDYAAMNKTMEHDTDVIVWFMKHGPAIRAALAHIAADSQKGEPVAWMLTYPNGEIAALLYSEVTAKRAVEGTDWTCAPLYTRPDGLTLKLARAVTILSKPYDPSYRQDFAASIITARNKCAATIKIAEEMVKEKLDAKL